MSKKTNLTIKRELPIEERVLSEADAIKAAEEAGYFADLLPASQTHEQALTDARHMAASFPGKRVGIFKCIRIVEAASVSPPQDSPLKTQDSTDKEPAP